jgi:hypothetical protein
VKPEAAVACSDLVVGDRTFVFDESPRVESDDVDEEVVRCADVRVRQDGDRVEELLRLRPRSWCGHPRLLCAALTTDCQGPVPARQFGSGTYRTVGRGLGGVDTAGAAAVVGESSVFAGAVMFDGVVADELFTDGDLEVIADDGDLDLAASELVANAVVGAGEADVAQRVDLSGDRYC